MVSSNAATPEAYLAKLTPERQEVIAAMRGFILAHLPEGYQESMRWGMLSYEVPLAMYADTYNKQPLGYVALAAQKRFNSLYLMGVYADPQAYQALLDAYQQAGLKPDLGKSCLHFREMSDLPLEKIGELIAATPPAAYIAQYENARQHTKKR